MTNWNYPVTRTPEQGHTRACLAKAMIAAVENLRDTDNMTDHDFRLQVQDGIPLQWADLYLNEGMTECVCPPIPAETPAVHACPECGGPLHEEAQRYGTGWHDCRGCGWRETSPTHLEEYRTPPEDAVDELDTIIGALDDPDLLPAEDATDALEAWVARWIPADAPWDPILGADDVTVVGVEFYTPTAGTVRLVVRTVTA